ncbi:glutamate racemase [Nitrosopumilus adriaticus]|uniref:Glutamate racemase n=1 Tax=Nitrosopumilus adriaticus TaxID=1580092 RepID=A0A0D5BZU5_9ARCH|nr:aspartate/glutamate racemase family protein [Nitrosopumilus adriaticus]AJW69702.1 Glutamate racemase [Nitrosopumilus adriaticus]
MVRIVVFDSGLGSLSVIKQIQKQMKCNIIYFADSKNFPYGKKTIKELRKITLESIYSLQKRFEPELIVVGSNTLSLTLDSHPKNILTIIPPINQAKSISKSKCIAVLATESIVKSKLLDDYLENFKKNNFKIIKINASPLIQLVESGKFYSNSQLCKTIIRKLLTPKFTKNNVDVATLSSTHLPFLLEFFKEIFPNITFLDPSKPLSIKLKNKYNDHSKKRNSLQIYTSGNIKSFKNKLIHLRIKNNISKFTLQ